MLTNFRKKMASLGTRMVVKSLISSSGRAASVLIVTRNQGTYLDLALASLSKQSLALDLWEVVIADCASQDDTQNIIAWYARASHLNIVSLRQQPSDGPVHTLNKAVELAAGSLLVFLGDDQLVHTDFLQQHLCAHRLHHCVFCLINPLYVHTHLFPSMDGVIRGVSPVPAVTRERFDYDRVVRPAYAFLAPQTLVADTSGEAQPWLNFDISNASVRREDLLSISGFTSSICTPRVAGIDAAFRLCRQRALRLILADGSSWCARQFRLEDPNERSACLDEERRWCQRQACGHDHADSSDGVKSYSEKGRQV